MFGGDRESIQNRCRAMIITSSLNSMRTQGKTLIRRIPYVDEKSTVNCNVIKYEREKFCKTVLDDHFKCSFLQSFALNTVTKLSNNMYKMYRLQILEALDHPNCLWYKVPTEISLPAYEATVGLVYLWEFLDTKISTMNVSEDSF